MAADCAQLQQHLTHNLDLPTLQYYPPRHNRVRDGIWLAVREPGDARQVHRAVVRHHIQHPSADDLLATDDRYLSLEDFFPDQNSEIVYLVGRWLTRGRIFEIHAADIVKCLKGGGQYETEQRLDTLMKLYKVAMSYEMRCVCNALSDEISLHTALLGDRYMGRVSVVSNPFARYERVCYSTHEHESNEETLVCRQSRKAIAHDKVIDYLVAELPRDDKGEVWTPGSIDGRHLRPKVLV